MKIRKDMKKPKRKNKPTAGVTWCGSDGRALQPIHLIDGIARFQGNAIVRLLLDDGKYDMNRLALLPFSDSDRAQFAQLIGYSVSGFGELGYVPNQQITRADKVAARLPREKGGK